MEKTDFLKSVMRLKSRRFHIERIRDVPEKEEIIGYLRLSTAEQAYDTNALKNQRDRLIEKDISLLVIDIKTGKYKNRPGLKYIMQRVNEERVKAIVVTRIDRLGRNSKNILDNVEATLALNIDIFALDQDIDMRTPQGKFILGVLAGLAEMEVAQTGNRVSEVKAYQRRHKFACDYPPFGYITENNQYQINVTPYLCLLESCPPNYLDLYDDNSTPISGLTIRDLARDSIDIFLSRKGTRPAIQEIVEKYGLGFTVSKKHGGNAVFYWSPFGLKNWLLNPVLRGHTAYKKRKQMADGRRVPLPHDQWQIAENTHPDERLLTDEEYFEIQRIFEFNSNRGGCHLYNDDPDQPTAYSEFAYQRGLVFCDQCGQRCGATSRHMKGGSKIYYYFYCKNRSRGCNNAKGTRRDLIERKLIEYLLQQSFVPSEEEEHSASSEIAHNSHQEKLEHLQTKLQQLEAIEGFDSTIEDVKAKTKQEIEHLSNPFHPAILANQTVRELIQAGNGLLLWHSLSADEKAEVYPRLIERITVDNGKVIDIVLKRWDTTGTSDFQGFE